MAAGNNPNKPPDNNTLAKRSDSDRSNWSVEAFHAEQMIKVSVRVSRRGYASSPERLAWFADIEDAYLNALTMDDETRDRILIHLAKIITTEFPPEK
ncbi:MAG: hypothetical protein JWS10_3499 [Cypionkella sp.]|uniref:hypothetical protein n=1 Tax=Cypionkella sp. TaxID=2811411 RepID=UPI00261D5297|nr:hypothetical protein [Cypionkella sp.]MDB5660884.1 hypothetical protein [Cypionkella sp.]